MKAVLFDLDGVITSERIYWNCAGMAVARSLGDLENSRELDAKDVLPDEVIKGFKEAGVNSNWDIAYCSSVLAKLGKDVREFLKELAARGYKGLEYLKLLDELDPSESHDREGGEWKESHKRFQACYYELADSDEPVIGLEKIENALKELMRMGLGLGIVTGRPLSETELPLKKWGLWNYFDSKMIVTETEIAEESERQGKHLGKPDPWPILHAIYANEGCESCGNFENDYVFVGDSVSDALSAKRAGIRCICVRTGIASEESLREAGADDVVDDVTELPRLIGKLRE
jgi:phosphoglycolate phosphatase-like HAD superfamily hydrolase